MRRVVLAVMAGVGFFFGGGGGQDGFSVKTIGAKKIDRII